MSDSHLHRWIVFVRYIWDAIQLRRGKGEFPPEYPFRFPPEGITGRGHPAIMYVREFKREDIPKAIDELEIGTCWWYKDREGVRIENILFTVVVKGESRVIAWGVAERLPVSPSRMDFTHTSSMDSDASLSPSSIVKFYAEDQIAFYEIRAVAEMHSRIVQPDLQATFVPSLEGDGPQFSFIKCLIICVNRFYGNYPQYNTARYFYVATIMRMLEISLVARSV